MKKYISVILLCTILLLVGCGKEATDNKEASSSETIASTSFETATHIETEAVTEEITHTTDETTLDLTAMNDHDAYHKLEQILLTPDNYIGKSITITGEYSSVHYSHAQQRYYYVLLADDDGCSQMLEFVWGDGSHVYPDEYPKEGTLIRVSGTFETYQDKGDPSIYCRLTNATLKVLD